MNKKLIGYLTIFTLLVQFSAPTLFITVTGLSILFSGQAIASDTTVTPKESDTKLLDELKKKYKLDDPYRNHKNTDKIYKTLGEPVAQPTRDLSELLTPSTTTTRSLNLPTTSADGKNPSELINQYKGGAMAVGLNNAAPKGDVNGNLDIKYSKEGTRKFVKDSDGKLIMKVTDTEPEYVEGLPQEEYLSSEVNRSDINFNADKAYGNNNLVLNEGRESHRTMSTGSDASSRAYQMVTQIADKGINTTIPDNSAFLAPSRSAFADVQTPTGGFFSACSTETETTTEELNFPLYDEYNCQANSAQNLNYCEVERELRVPALVEGDGFASCGPGCYELTIDSGGDNSYMPSCGDACASEIYTESKMVTLKLTDGMKLENVSASATFDDHFELLIDDKIAFSQIDGTFSYNSRLPTPPTNAGRKFGERGNDSMNMRPVNTGVKRHIVEGEKIYNFKVNTLVGGAGEMLMKIRFQFSDDTGAGFGEIVTQTPENCLELAGAEYILSNQSQQQSNNLTGSTNNGTDSFIPVDYTGVGGGTGGGTGGTGGGTGGTGGGTGTSGINVFVDRTATNWGSQCTFDGYKVLEDGSRGYPQDFLDFIGPMYPGDTGNKTWKIELENYRCDPLSGEEICVINGDTGQTECHTWDELLAKPNQCEAYEQDSSCSEISRTCTDGWSIETEDSGEVCYNETVTYSCESANTITREVTKETSSCAGALPCSGGDCEIGETESNTRFIEAAVQANVLQQVDGDRFCESNTDPSTCKIFTGEAEYCSWEVTGLGMDCCEAPGGMDILSYVMTANLMMRTNKMAADGLFGETAEGAADSLIEFSNGAYDTLAQPIEAGWNTISEPITSAYNSLMGNATNTVVDATGQTIAEAGATASEGVISSTLASLQQEAYSLVYDMMPDELANLLFDEVTEGVGEEATKELVLNETLTSALQTVMSAYSIYSTVKLALTLLTMCDENESDMGIKLGQRQCFKVGNDYCSKDVLGICYQKRQDYCCYNSILARIIMEQAGPILGKDLTTCEGLTQAELGTLDFNQIDLSEWTALMIESGSIKDEANEQNLTGAGELVGSRCETFEVEDPDTGQITVEERCFKELEGGRELNTYGRENVSDRTIKRLEGAKVYSDGAKANARGVANNLDCSASPRPPVCEFGFDIRDNGGN